MSFQRKRSRSAFEEDDLSSHRVGVAETLALLRDDDRSDEKKESAPTNGLKREANHNDDKAGGEWQVAQPKHKRKKSNRNKKQKQTGKGNYPEIGHSSHARLQTQVRIGDLQGLVLYILADGPSPQWCSVRHHAEIKKVVVLMVPGLEKSMFDGSTSLSELAESDKNIGEAATSSAIPKSRKPVSPDEYYPLPLHEKDLPETLKPMARMFPHIWPVKTPGDDRMNRMHSPMASMLQAAIPKNQEDKDKTAKGPGPPRGEKSWENQPQPITTFLATRDQFSDNDYVLHPALLSTDEEKESEVSRRQSESQTSEHGWADSSASSLTPEPPRSTYTKDTEKIDLTGGKRILALDCEMCMTGPNEFSLTRISYINWDGSVLFDSLVKPAKPITDYLTPYSGITAAMLEPITTTLADIQAKLLPLLTTDTILVGHSLNSDMNALQLTHPNLVDTSILYPHPRGPPLKSSLKWLSQKYLKEDIQKGGAKGHNSIEDARAALDLVKQKCQRGIKWGTAEATNESIFKRIGRSPKPGLPAGSEVQVPSRNTHNVTACVDWGVPARGYGASADICIGCSSDAEVVEGIKRAVRGDDDGKEIPGGGVEFVWARLRELEAVRGWWRSSKLKETDELRTNAIAGAEAETQVQADGIDAATSAENGSKEEDKNGQDLFAAAAVAHESVVAREPAAPFATNPFTTLNTTTSTPNTATINPSTASTPAILPTASTSPPTPTTLLHKTLTTTLTHLSQIHASLPPCTALVIYSGSGDPRELSRLQNMQAQFKREYATKKWDELSIKWTDVEEQELKQAARAAREGCGFVVVK